MAQLLLTVDQEGVILADLCHGGVGVVHVLAVPGKQTGGLTCLSELVFAHLQ